VGVASGGRFFGHYYYQLLPPLALLAGWQADELWTHLRELPWTAPSKLVLMVGLVLGLGFAMNEYGCLDYRFMVRLGQMVRRQPPLPLNLMGADDLAREAGAYLAQNTPRSERLFVWGFWPEIYWYAQRRPASRFTNCNFITGLYPGAITPGRERPRPFLARGLRLLLQDLERTRPLYLLDTSSLTYGRYMFAYQEFPFSRYPALAEYVEEHYQLQGELARMRLYRRRSTEGAP
jgi:hypothetical protein